MKYCLIDKITACDAGKEIKAIKGVSLAEEYLQDHFPSFPVLPGVFLLQGMVEAASWLVRISQAFAHSMVLLQQARNVKYKSFLAPGMQIEYNVTAKSLDEKESRFQGIGTANGQTIVEARFGLRHFNLGDTQPALASADADIVSSLKARYKLLQ